MKYGEICHNLSYNIVNSRRDAEECVNDAYLGAWNAIPPGTPKSLVVLHCENRAEHFPQKPIGEKEADKRSGHYTVALEEIEGCIADQKTVEDEIEARELARIIEEFLDTLTVENRVIFMRRYWFVRQLQGHSRVYGAFGEKHLCPADPYPRKNETILD